MKALFIIFIAIALFSCSEEDSPYPFDVKYIYFAKYSKSEFKDKVTLQKFEVDGFISKIVWDSEIRQDPGSSTGITLEANVSNARSNIEIPSPMGAYLDMTGLLPYPRVDFPIKVGDSTSSHHKIEYKHNPYNGRVIDGYLKVIGTTTYNNPLVEGKCWVIEAHNYSTADTSATFYFNDKLGFVYYKYKMGTDSIIIALEALVEE